MILIGMSFPQLGSTRILRGYGAAWGRFVVAFGILGFSSLQFLFNYISADPSIYLPLVFILPIIVTTVVVLGTVLQDLHYGGFR